MKSEAIINLQNEKNNNKAMCIRHNAPIQIHIVSKTKTFFAFYAQHFAYRFIIHAYALSQVFNFGLYFEHFHFVRSTIAKSFNRNEIFDTFTNHYENQNFMTNYINWCYTIKIRLRLYVSVWLNVCVCVRATVDKCESNRNWRTNLCRNELRSLSKKLKNICCCNWIENSVLPHQQWLEREFIRTKLRFAEF